MGCDLHFERRYYNEHTLPKKVAEAKKLLRELQESMGNYQVNDIYSRQVVLDYLNKTLKLLERNEQ